MRIRQIITRITNTTHDKGQPRILHLSFVPTNGVALKPGESFSCFGHLETVLAAKNVDSCKTLDRLVESGDLAVRHIFDAIDEGVAPKADGEWKIMDGPVAPHQDVARDVFEPDDVTGEEVEPASGEAEAEADEPVEEVELPDAQEATEAEEAIDDELKDTADPGIVESTDEEAEPEEGEETVPLETPFDQ